MSNKNKQLLNESTVRRFMGLAGIGALTDNAVGKLQEQDELEAPPEEEAPPMDAAEEELPPDVEGELEGELEGEEEGPADIDLSHKEAKTLVDLGRRLEVEMPEEGLEGEAGMPPGTEMAGEEGAPEMPLGPEMGMPPEEETAMVQEAFIKELSHRVARRATQEQTFNEELSRRVAGRVKKEQIINETMKRVAKRLTRKRRRRR